MIQQVSNVEALAHLQTAVQTQQLIAVDVAPRDVGLQGFIGTPSKRHQALAVLINSMLVQLLHQRAAFKDVEDLLHAIRRIHIRIVQVLDKLRSPVT